MGDGVGPDARRATQKAGAIKTSTDPSVNPHAAAMADFKARVEKYAALHKRLAKGAAAQKENANPDEITAQKTSWPRRSKPHARVPNTATSLLLSCAGPFGSCLRRS